jgi:hypothetical protein
MLREAMAETYPIPLALALAAAFAVLAALVGTW